MTVESASYISQLDTTLPTASDLISEGDDHLRLTKTVLKTQFPNFGTTAISASAAEVNYSVGVTSAIQTQINGKGAIAGQAWTGAHSFAGATSVPTLSAGTNTTGAASTAFVQADFLQKFPNYTAPVNASTAELNYLVGVTSAIQPQLSNQVAGPIHAATAKTTPADADELGITDSAASWGLKKLTFANLKAWIGGLFVSKSGDTMTGNLDFSGTALRIRGDFSNATQASRLAFQTSTVNGNTSLTAIPNGTATGAAYNVLNSSDPNNASYGQILAGVADIRLLSAAVGSGTQLPLQFYIGSSKVVDIGTNRRVALTPNNENFALQLNNGSTTNGPLLGSAGADIFVVSTSAGTEVLRTDASRNVLVTGSGALGYGVGSGGTVTQATSKSTDVTLNKPYGAITMNNAALGAGATVNFLLNNTLIGANDSVLVVVRSGVVSAIYQAWCAGIGGGICEISVRNNSGASASDAVVLHFAVIKGATS